MWIPEVIHKEIKQQSNMNNLSIKDYILKLHRLQVSTNILQSDDFQKNKLADQKIDELVIKFDKILEKMETKPGVRAKPKIIQKTQKVSILPSTSIPPKIRQFIIDQKLQNPRFKENNYEETIKAIVKGNHLKKDIDSYRGKKFYNTNSKNSEKPLLKLVSEGILEVHYENEKIPNQKSYYICPAYK